MENSCPNCGKEIQPYHQFCPWCDADFSPDRKNGQVQPESAKEPVKEDLTCPACGKPIQAYHEFCPWCNVDFPFNEQPQADNSPPAEELIPVTGETAEHQAQNLHNEPPVQSDTLTTGASYCSNCGNPLIAGFRVCNVCGVAVQGVQMHESSLTNQNETAFIPPSGQVIQHPGIESQVTGWKSDGPVPLSIHFNTGKIYRKNIIDVLEFQIVNNSPWPINDLIFIVKGKLISKPLAEQLPFILLPSILHAFHVTGFIPYHPGKDALKITITGKTPGPGEFHLSGTALITVRDEIKNTPPQKIDVNISSGGPLIVDMEDTLANMGLDKPDNETAEIDRWEPVPLFWDVRKMERKSRSFPPACILPETCSLDQHCLAGLQSISPENAPKAVLSCETGEVYNLIAGSCLFLGRKIEINHFQPVLFPMDHYQNENLKVSKQHCQIFIRENRVYIRDTSHNGTFLGNGRITKNQETLLLHDEIITIADILKIQAKIFTDGQRILCVFLKRIHNKTQEHHIMVNSLVPLGANPNLPIVMPGMPDYCGAIYFHPQSRSWRFKQPGAPNDMSQDAVLEGFQEMVFGCRRYWFSIV